MAILQVTRAPIASGGPLGRSPGARPCGAAAGPGFPARGATAGPAPGTDPLHRLSLGRFAEAQAVSDAGLQRQPGVAELLVNRSLVHKRLGRPDLALADLTRALTLRPGLPEALANRGVLRAEAGDHAGAVANLEAALAAAPPDWRHRPLLLDELARQRGH